MKLVILWKNNDWQKCRSTNNFASDSKQITTSIILNIVVVVYTRIAVVDRHPLSASMCLPEEGFMGGGLEMLSRFSL